MQHFIHQPSRFQDIFQKFLFDLWFELVRAKFGVAGGQRFFRLRIKGGVGNQGIDKHKHGMFDHGGFDVGPFEFLFRQWNEFFRHFVRNVFHVFPTLARADGIAKTHWFWGSNKRTTSQRTKNKEQNKEQTKKNMNNQKTR